MSNEFSIEANWLESGRNSVPRDEDLAERATRAEVTVRVEDVSFSAMQDVDTGAVYPGVRLPAIVLAEGLVRNWWQMMHEPQRTQDHQQRANFESRHRLDGLTLGYVFPPIGIWSAGEAVMLGCFKPDTRFAKQTFIPPSDIKPRTIGRRPLEDGISAFVTATLERSLGQGERASDLKADWDQVIASTQDPEELAWCANAGRLGLDPYSPETPDLGRLAAGIPATLFSDICESTDIGDLAAVCDWVRSVLISKKTTPIVSVKDFKGPPYRDLGVPGWRNGIEGVALLRDRLSLPLEPKAALRQIFPDIDRMADDRFLTSMSLSTIEGVVRRSSGEIRATLPPRSGKQMRFRMCRATYLGWRAGGDTDTAITPAETWRQQASRAFAAELMAPARLIKDRYGKTGLNKAGVDRLSAEWLCPPRIIAHQAANNGIKVSGAEAAAHW